MIRFKTVRLASAFLASIGLSAAAPTRLEAVPSCANWTEVSTSPHQTPSPRYGHAMAYANAVEAVVLFGGMGTAADLNDTWFWYGAGWAKVDIAGPPARWGHAMAYDADREVVVLFGGKSGNHALGDTWELDLSNPAAPVWTEVVVSQAPDPQTPAGMAYDRARRRTILVTLNGTWSYGGVEWRLASPQTPANGYGLATVAYDRNRETIVSVSDHLYEPQTHEWDGRDWTLVAAGGITARYGAAMAFDPDRARMVVASGMKTSPGDTLLDTWEWDGAYWRLATPTENPGRIFHAAAFHEITREVVLFGGATGISLTDIRSETYTLSSIAPAISQHPMNTTVVEYLPVTLTVSADATGEILQYQWRKHGDPIQGAHGPSLTISQATVDDAGTYDVVVSTACGVPELSHPAVVTVLRRGDYDGDGDVDLADFAVFSSIDFTGAQAGAP